MSYLEWRFYFRFVDFPRTQARFRFAYLAPAGSLAVALAAFGTANWVAGVLGVLAWLTLCTIQTGQEISTDLHRSRDYFALLSWRFGSWHPLPPVIGVTLKYYSSLEKASTPSATSWGVWNNPQKRHEELIVMLSLQHSANGLILAYFGPDDVNTAIDFAHDTAERFRVPVNQYLPPHLYQPMPSAIGDSDNG